MCVHISLLQGQPQDTEIKTVRVRTQSQVVWFNVVQSAREACVQVLRECKQRHLPRCERDFTVKTVKRAKANTCNGNAHDCTGGAEYAAAEIVDDCEENCVQVRGCPVCLEERIRDSS